MAEQQEEDENKRMRPREQAHGQKRNLTKNMFSKKPETSQL